MTKIAILGGNGQTGTQVAWHLKTDFGVTPKCFVRSEYGATLLQMLGIEFEIIDYADSNKLRRQLADCALIADFTYPSAPMTDIVNIIERQIDAIMSAMPRDASFTYASSLMAFGMRAGETRVRRTLLSLSSYGEIKRAAERWVRTMGKKHGLHACSLRLGQVHGVLQASTRAHVAGLEWNAIRTPAVATERTITVFAYSVASALLQVRDQSPEAGTYSVVSQPQWTLEELYGFFRRCYGVDADVEYHETEQSAGASLQTRIIQRVTPYRGLLEAYVLRHFPTVFRKIKGRYRASATARPSALDNRREVRHLVGDVPGPTLPGIDSLPDHVLAAETILINELQRVTVGTDIGRNVLADP